MPSPSPPLHPPHPQRRVSGFCGAPTFLRAIIFRTFSASGALGAAWENVAASYSPCKTRTFVRRALCGRAMRVPTGDFPFNCAAALRAPGAPGRRALRWWTMPRENPCIRLLALILVVPLPLICAGLLSLGVVWENVALRSGHVKHGRSCVAPYGCNSAKCAALPVGATCGRLPARHTHFRISLRIREMMRFSRREM